MGNRIGVITTIGPDSGLTRDERVARAQKRRWENVLDRSIQKLAKIEAMIPTASAVRKVALEAKSEDLREQIFKAKMELVSTVN
jgi:hypothetical protein